MIVTLKYLLLVFLKLLIQKTFPTQQTRGIESMLG